MSKYSVTNNEDIEGKHITCDFFVLDLTHDPVARNAVLMYARAKGDFKLYKELNETIDLIVEQENDSSGPQG